MMNTMSDNEREQESGAATVQEIAGGQELDRLSFLPQLFGGLIIHIQKSRSQWSCSLPSDVSNEEET